MHRSEKELRKAAEHVAPLLPDDEGEARRVCDLALELKRWESGGDQPDNAGGDNVSILRRD